MLIIVMRKALIIFVRHPELGKVKTRLAHAIGNEQALKVYCQLLQHTHDITTKLDCDKYVYYVDNIRHDDLWENDLFNKRVQEGETLGDRMLVAFFELFHQGYSAVAIIGSDCPGLTDQFIDEAFKKLASTDVVIGPSADGGYYLLGLRQLLPSLFSNKQWSSGSVLSDTIKDTIYLQKSCTFLPELYDIDTVEDLRRYEQAQQSI